MIWRILEHIMLILSLLLNVFFLVYIASLFHFDLNAPAFPNLAGKKERENDPWKDSEDTERSVKSVIKS